MTAIIKKPAARPVAWAAMEPLYRAGAVPLAKLSRDFGVSRAAIHKHAAKHGWIRALQASGNVGPTEDGDAQWQETADAALRRLVDLFAGAYEVLERFEEREHLIGPMEEVCGAVADMVARRGKYTRDELDAVMREVRAVVEEAQQRAADLKVVAWDALAQEILRVVGAVAPAAESFVRGRDLAIGMLRVGDEFQGDGIVEAQRRFRYGKPQERFARGPLQELIRHPELLEGFAAVLSGRLGVQEPLKAADFDLPLAEYEPGEVGADGTVPHDEDAHAPDNTAPAVVQAAPEPAPGPAHAAKDTRRRELSRKAMYQANAMLDGLRCVLQGDDFEGKDEAVEGMLSRIKVLTDVVFHAAQLDGPEAAGRPQRHSLQDLQRVFGGML